MNISELRYDAGSVCMLRAQLPDPAPRCAIVLAAPPCDARSAAQLAPPHRSCSISFACMQMLRELRSHPRRRGVGCSRIDERSRWSSLALLHSGAQFIAHTSYAYEMLMRRDGDEAMGVHTGDTAREGRVHLTGTLAHGPHSCML